jgi:hypothetical protein
MDPLTHGLLGASLGQVLSGPALGRRALAWGAGERFERPLPTHVSKIPYTLWRETLGWS